MKSPSGSSSRQASRSTLYGDIRLAMQIMPASANSFATSPICLFFVKLDTLCMKKKSDGNDTHHV